MRTAYVGPATVLINDTERSVEANLWKHVDQTQTPTGDYVQGLSSWGGTLIGVDEATAWAIFESENNPKLRIGEREGDFLAGEGNLGGGPLTITGSGPAPFDS